MQQQRNFKYSLVFCLLCFRRLLVFFFGILARLHGLYDLCVFMTFNGVCDSFSPRLVCFLRLLFTLLCSVYINDLSNVYEFFLIFYAIHTFGLCVCVVLLSSLCILNFLERHILSSNSSPKLLFLFVYISY